MSLANLSIVVRRADLSRLGNGDGRRGALLIGGENSARRRTERSEAGSECPPRRGYFAMQQLNRGADRVVRVLSSCNYRVDRVGCQRLLS